MILIKLMTTPNDTSGNNGTIIMDATCVPSDISYPQDLNLLNEARENLEKIIDNLNKDFKGKKARTYRKVTKKRILENFKSKKKPTKKLRKVIRKQLGYIHIEI